MLTYMSIRTQINNCAKDGRLIFRAPNVPSQGVRRDVFVSRQLNDFIEFNEIDTSFERASGRAMAKIDAFASGKAVVLALDPHSKSPATMVARNSPWQRGVVDLRVTSYTPDVRLFGCFAEKDVLILLTWAPKTELHYGTQISRCRSVWDSLFPEHEPLIGTKHDEYLSHFIPG